MFTGFFCAQLKKFDDRIFLERSGHTSERLALELPLGARADGAAISQPRLLSPDNRHFYTTPAVPRACIAVEIKNDRFSQSYPTAATACPRLLLLWAYILHARSITKHHISYFTQRHVLVVGKLHAVQCFCAKSLPKSKAPLSKRAALGMKQSSSSFEDGKQQPLRDFLLNGASSSEPNQPIHPPSRQPPSPRHRLSSRNSNDRSVGQANRGQNESDEVPGLADLIWKYFESEIRDALSEAQESIAMTTTNVQSS